jgi:YD repeat-containing protein
LKSLPASLKSIALVIALVFLFSCSEKDHEPQSACVFIGKTTSYESKGGVNTKYSATSELDQDDPKMPRSLLRTSINENTDGTTNEHVSKVTETYKFTFQYDNAGFLKTMVSHKSYLFQGSGKSSYHHINRLFKIFRSNEIRTTDFTYQSGRAMSVSIKTVTTTQGDDQAPVVSELAEAKVYQYDGNGQAISALTTSTEGNIASTFVNGIIASSTQKNKNDVVVSETQYNAMGLNSSIALNGAVYQMKWDTKGNLTSVQLINSGKVVYTQEFGYDDHENPDNAINKIFKGIPEVIQTIQLTDGVNNLVSEQSTNDKGQVTFHNKTTYQYNSSGMPESSKTTRVGDASASSVNTTFHYKCQ